MSFTERADRFEELFGETRSRSDADQVLAGLLADRALEPSFRIDVVAALGDVAGPVGSAVIRAEFISAWAQLEKAKPHNRWIYRDLMCACLWALGKRDGPAATDVLAEATAHASFDVRSYGFMILASVGDDRVWDDMRASLALRLAKKITSERQANEAIWTIRYLARHCTRNSDRREQLISLLRDRWNRLLVRHQQVLEELYPGIEPSGPEPAKVDLATNVPAGPWVRPSSHEQWERQSGHDAFEVTNGPAGWA